MKPIQHPLPARASRPGWIRPVLGAVLLVAAVAWLGGCASLDEAEVTEGNLGRTPVPEAGYQVQRGDTLRSVAGRFGLDYRRVAAWNRLTAPYRIYPGQRLWVKPPGVTGFAPAPDERTAPAPVPNPKTRPALVPVAKDPGTGPAEPAPLDRPARTDAPDRGDLAWRWPTGGAVIQTFQAADATRRGIRIAGQVGQSVTACEAGKVVYSGDGLVGFGKLIIIKHADSYLTAYGFNRRLLVKEGDRVAKGDRIAEMGRTEDGQAALHLEIRHQGEAVDPLRLLPRR